MDQVCGNCEGRSVKMLIQRASIASEHIMRTVRGAQADGAKSLGLIKITRPSAKALWDRKVPIVIVGNKVAPFHFFGGWRLAMRSSNEHYTCFDSFANNFALCLDGELGNQVAFFVFRDDLLRSAG
jgi:hypothetical protein